MTLDGATCPNRTDDLLIHTTTIFIAITENYVCSLDFLFTISNDLGTSCKVSTLGINLARDCHINNYLGFPELAMSTLYISI